MNGTTQADLTSSVHLDSLRVLVAVGDSVLLDGTARPLEENGFTVLRASDDASAFKSWQNDGPDVVLIDVGLPSHGGFAFCRDIREKSRTPVIMLAAEVVESDVVTGFTSGADDFVVPPFGTRQLAWRIRAIHGRYTSFVVTPPVVYPRVGDLTIDVDQHEIVRGAARAQLTPTEFRIFELLAANQGSIVSAARLLEVARPNKVPKTTGTVGLKTHVAHLRQKLRTLGGQPRHISGIPGKGYLLPDVPASSGIEW